MAEIAMAETNGRASVGRNPFIELGVSGLKEFGGRLQEEYLRAWQPQSKAKTITEMMTDDMVSASMWLFELLIRQVVWSISPATNDTAGQEAANFAREVLFEDMSHSWTEFLSEALSMLPWGWAYHEIVWKRRSGESRDPSMNSHFTDGRIGIRKIPLRGQSTLNRWLLDTSGGIQGMVQRGARGGDLTIPIEKALLFRTTQHKQSPEGRSILRAAFIPWYQKKHISQLQAIGIERDAAGLPIVRVPNSIMTDSANATVFTAYKKLAINIRQDEQGGVVLPSDRDEHGQYLYSLDLLSAPSRKQIDTLPVLSNLDRRIATALMTDVLLLGHERVGSLALSSDKTSLLSQALGSVLEIIIGVFNRHLMPRLWRMNALNMALMPLLTHGDIEIQDLNEIASFMRDMSLAGFDIFDLEDEWRRRTGFPIRVESER